MLIRKTKQLIKEYPSHTVFLSLLIMIFAGTLVLALPICRHTSIQLIDLFFIATSLLTVTGFSSIPLQDFTNIGHVVILILMQIGGLGLMTMSLFIMSLFVDFGLYTQVLASEILSIQSFKDTKRILIFIIKLTLMCELLGAIATFFVIKNDYSLSKALFLSIFHSISSFCNVGISLFKYDTLSYNNNILMLITTTLLILFGSLGFVTWHEFSKIIKKWYHKDPHHKISWHTYLVLKTFFLTTIITSILFWLLERQNTLHDMTPLQTFLNVILIGISSKSTGYLTVAITLIQPATILLLLITAFIGSAPSSTGGGIKTSAFAIFLSVIRATVYGRAHAEIHSRRIARDQVYKAMAIIALACSWILIITFCLLITEQGHGFLDILLETVSAFANNGISLGITPFLTIAGKLFIIATMIVGRIGALALIIGMRRSSDTADFSYPEERVILG
ncbi:MAG: potassium transporter TrkG [Candidatus Chromulinivorax sp.]|nr:potassium transporter TrkG [Candidatus Chromulinivorax sp.]